VIDASLHLLAHYLLHHKMFRLTTECLFAEGGVTRVYVSFGVPVGNRLQPDSSYAVSIFETATVWFSGSPYLILDAISKEMIRSNHNV